MLYYCVVIQIYVTFQPHRKWILLLIFIWHIFCTCRSWRKKAPCKYFKSGFPPEKNGFIWNCNGHKSVSTKQIATGASLVCHMRLCNVALTNICTPEKWRESSHTLCCPLLWHCEIWYWLWSSLSVSFDDGLDSVLWRRNVLESLWCK